MKVSIVTMVFPAPAETFVSTEVEALRRHGADVAVHAIGPGPKDAERVLADRHAPGLHVTQGTLSNQFLGIGQCLARPWLVASLLWMIIKHTATQPRHWPLSLLVIPRVVQLFLDLSRDRPDVVHLYWGHYPALLGHLLCTRHPEIVLSMSLSAYDLQSGYGPSAPVARQADVVRTWSAANRPAIESMGVAPDRILVCYQPMDVSRAGNTTADAKVRRRIVSVGRLIESKGMDDVLRVFQRVRESWSDATLVILGDGPERARLRRLAEQLSILDAVRLEGHVPHDQVFRELAAAEVFLLMSRHAAERLPNVVKESMASRCLCVVSDTTGIDELMTHGEQGWMVPRGDVAAAAQWIEKIFSRESAYREIADAAAAHVRERFDTDSMARQLSGRWTQLCDAKRPPGKEPSIEKR